MDVKFLKTCGLFVGINDSQKLEIFAEIKLERKPNFCKSEISREAIAKLASPGLCLQVIAFNVIAYCWFSRSIVLCTGYLNQHVTPFFHLVLNTLSTLISAKRHL